MAVRRGSRIESIARCWIGGVLLLSLCLLCGCSLVSIKTPEKPLSPRDLNARILTHEFAARFNAAVEQTADEIASASDDATVRNHALRWKIAATDSSERAASQMVPMLSLIDMWALVVQMRDYLSDGAGAQLFGAQQPQAVMLAASLADEVHTLARNVLSSADLDDDQRFIDRFVHEHPIESLSFARASIVDEYLLAYGAQNKLSDSLGTVPEALGETGDLLRMYGDSVPSQALWRAQLVTQQSGLNAQDIQDALRRLDERLSHLSTLADSTPQLFGGMVNDVGKRFDSSWLQMAGTLRTERIALADEVSTQRQAAVAAVDMERIALAADAARISSQVITDTGEQVRRLVREALTLIIVLAIVVLGLPFAAGYWVGRAHRRS